MICVCGSEDLKTKIARKFNLSGTPEYARCVVVELPGYINDFPGADVPVLCVATDMFSLSEWQAVKNNGAKLVSEEQLEAKIKDILGSNDKITTAKKEIRAVVPAVFGDVEPASTTKNNLIVSSASSVPGVGKTLLTINLGAYAALNGIKAVVVDADIVGDAAQALGLELKGSYATPSTWRNFSLPEALLRHRSGLYVMPCSWGEELSPEDVRDLLVELKKEFSLVIVDHGNNPFLLSSKAALAMSDLIFVLAGQNQKTLDKGMRLFEENKNIDRKKFKLVVNMVSPLSGFYSPRQVARVFGFDEYEEIPLDHKGVNAATRTKKAVVQLSGSRAGAALRGIAEKHLFSGFPLKKQAAGFFQRLLGRR